MADVFISYSSKDREQAERLLTYLEEHSVDCWMAPRNIPGGSYYAKEIPNAIHEAPVFLIVLSKNAQESEYVLRELDYASSLKHTILPYAIDEEPLVPEFDFLLRTKQRYQPLSEELVDIKLLDRIQSICNKGAMPENLPVVITSEEIEEAEVDESICCPLCDSKNLWESTDWLQSLSSTYKHIAWYFLDLLIALACMLFSIISDRSSENNHEYWQSYKFYLLYLLPFIMLSVFRKIVLWIEEHRRRDRVRKHIEVTRMECIDCKYKFNIVIDLKTGKVLSRKGIY